jgi:hypothetical protein
MPKFSFLVEVEVDQVEHDSLNAKRINGGRAPRTPNEDISFEIEGALSHKFITSVVVAPAIKEP